MGKENDESKGVGGSGYRVNAYEVKTSEGKRRLWVGIRNLEDEYDGMVLVLTPAQAKAITKVIFHAAREMEK